MSYKLFHAVCMFTWNTTTNLDNHRISLVNPLPNFTSTLGFPLMQPLCGTVLVGSARGATST